jgi:hypothetical protein
LPVSNVISVEADANKQQPKRRFNMATQKVKVKMGFGSLVDADAVTLSGNVAAGLPVTFDLKTLIPPVDPGGLKGAHDDLVAAIEAAANGGRTQTADKRKKRKVVNEMLDKLAHFVQIHCNNDEKTVLSAGFLTITNTHTHSPLGVPNIISVDNGNAGQLVIRARSVRNAKSYEVRQTTVAANAQTGAWQLIGSFAKARSIVISGLTAGTTYAFSVRAVGGSTERGDWSDPVAHMAM